MHKNAAPVTAYIVERQRRRVSKHGGSNCLIGFAVLLKKFYLKKVEGKVAKPINHDDFSLFYLLLTLWSSLDLEIICTCCPRLDLPEPGICCSVYAANTRFHLQKHTNLKPLEKQRYFKSEAALSVQIFPWETEFMNNALWSPRGARAGERNRVTGYTLPPARAPRGGQWALHLVQSSMDEKSQKNKQNQKFKKQKRMKMKMKGWGGGTCETN